MTSTEINLAGIKTGGWLRDGVLGTLADVLDDLESVRIANENRVRILTRGLDEKDADGEERGFGLSPDNPIVAQLIRTVEEINHAEKDAVKNLQKAMRQHPLGEFIKPLRGVGEKQFARLLATIGDPYWNDAEERPRKVSELWSYCGYGVRNGAAPRRQRGQLSNWSEDARKRAFVIAESCVKSGRGADDKRGPQEPERDRYRIVYDNAKAKYEGSVHSVECVRCGPKGKPAPVGSPRKDGHIHAMALRIVAKELLKDVWIESKRLYEEE